MKSGEVRRNHVSRWSSNILQVGSSSMNNANVFDLAERTSPRVASEDFGIKLLLRIGALALIGLIALAHPSHLLSLIRLR